MKAVGVHVFAGGFTMGMKAAGFEIPAQVEIHNFGRETVESLGVPFVNEPHWEAWSDHREMWDGCRMCYGNPRCTGFSSMTGGMDKTAHGPDATCTVDIHDVCKFGVQQGFDLVAWESVQQAYTTGRPLLNRLIRDYFEPENYRVAHVFITASSFGNAQKRKRYFFVAYRGGNFNVEAPPLPARQKYVGDVLGDPYLAGRTTRPYKMSRKEADHDPDCYTTLDADSAALLPHLPERCDVNKFAREQADRLREISPHLWGKWEERQSDKPFSMHCIRRLKWDRSCPTIASSGRNFVHPREDRPLTIRELAYMMGWPKDVTPLGCNPVAQIAKGICPEVGQWLGEQCRMFLDGHWGREDWETRYDHHTDEWVGHDHTGSAEPPLEKVIHLGNYVPYDPNTDGDPDAVRSEEQCGVGE